MPPKGEAYNVDWVWSSTSNVHVTNHRDWFTAFTPIESHISLISGSSDRFSVQGIGEVELEVRKYIGEAAKKRPGPKNSTVVLHQVLFVPDFPCNIFGAPITQEYDVSIGAERWLMVKRTGAAVGLLDAPRLTKLLLKGQAKGQTSLDANTDYDVNVIWPEEEREKSKAATA